jgi:hypothetical protein
MYFQTKNTLKSHFYHIPKQVLKPCLFLRCFCALKKYFFFQINFYVFLDYFGVLMLKINFKK